MKKDARTGGVINTDKEALFKYKRDKLVSRKLEQLQKHICDLKSSISSMDQRIKQLEQR